MDEGEPSHTKMHLSMILLMAWLTQNSLPVEQDRKIKRYYLWPGIWSTQSQKPYQTFTPCYPHMYNANYNTEGMLLSAGDLFPDLLQILNPQILRSIVVATEDLWTCLEEF